MGFAAGFRAGWDSVSDALKERERKDMIASVKSALEASPEQSTGFTAEQGKELEDATKAGGQVAYDEAQKAYVITPADGGAARTVGMQNVTDFLGDRTAGAMDESQVQAARSRHIGNTLARQDPLAGERYRQAALATQEAERRMADDAELRQVLNPPQQRPAQTGMQRSSEVSPRGVAPGSGSVGGGADTPMLTGQVRAGAEASGPGQDAGRIGVAAPDAAPAAESAAATATGARKNEGPDADLRRYLDQMAPKAIATLIKQGKVKEANELSTFVDTQEGQAYARTWVKGIRHLEAGNHAGALKIFENLYNTQIDDGFTVRMTPGEDGKTFQVDQIDAAGKVLGSRQLPIADLTQSAASALSPFQAAKHYAERALTREKDDALLDREDLRQRRLDERERARQRAAAEALDKRLEAQNKALEARLNQLGQRGGLTASQQRQNAEIDAARERVAGMAPDEIRRRTAKTTDTGRDNPDYDPALARAATLAGRRKIGDDMNFDARQSPGQAPRQDKAAPALPDRAEIAKRFRADRTMNAYTLGKPTPRGYEVIKEGRVIGYFN